MKIVVYIDGLTEPVNPKGITTCAFVVYMNGSKVHEESMFVGEGEGFSNNVGEYSALCAAMKWLIEKGYIKDVEIRSDSRLLVNQMNGYWKVKKGYYVPYYERAEEMRSKFENISFRWIPREQNKEADRLSRLAYQKHVNSR